MQTPEVLSDTKKIFENFADTTIREGLDKGELADRKFFTKRYKDALWVQFGVILNFWVNDNSTGFEKTDEAIERGINLTFDLFERSTLDNLIDYGKFFARSSRFKRKMRILKGLILQIISPADGADTSRISAKICTDCGICFRL